MNDTPVLAVISVCYKFVLVIMTHMPFRSPSYLTGSISHTHTHTEDQWPAGVPLKTIK